MKKCLPLLVCAAFMSFLLPASAEVGAKVTFPDFSSGHVYGSRISAADLRGKVVFFEYWGINCPPCRAAMPHLIELQKKYGSKGLVVIGSHVQFMSPAVKTYLEENKVNFPIYEHKRLPQAPCPGGIPFSVLIGADGRIIAEGLPSQIYGKVEDAVAQVSKGYPILDGVELSKYKSLERVIVSNGNNVEGKIEELRSAAGAGDTEAEAICSAYDSWLSLEKDRIAGLCETNPIQAMQAISTLKKAVPSVTDFDDQVQDFKENPAFKKLVTLQKKMLGLQKRQAQGKRVSAGAVKGLRKSLEEVRAMEGEGIDSVCDSLDAELDSLEGASASSSSREKPGKRARN